MALSCSRSVVLAAAFVHVLLDLVLDLLCELQDLELLCDDARDHLEAGPATIRVSSTFCFSSAVAFSEEATMSASVRAP